MRDSENDDLDAFISYRRADGHKIAAGIHRALREYRLPPELREGRREPLRVYIDVLHESATEDFWADTVRPHLLAARRLIVVSTPTARDVLPGGQPNWLVREIQTYLAERREPKVSIVIGGGEFDAPLPADLHIRYPNIERVDLRASVLGRWLRPSVRRRLHNGLLTLVAALHQVNGTEMLLLRRWDEQQLQRRRFITALAVAAVAAVFIVVFAFAAFAAASQRRDAVAAATLRGRAIYDERPAEARLHFAAAAAYASRWWPPFAREDAADARAWLAQRYGVPPKVFLNEYEWDPDQFDVARDVLLLRDGRHLRVGRISTGEFQTPPVSCNDTTEGGWVQEGEWIVVPGSPDDRSSACVMSMDGRIIYAGLPRLRPETLSVRVGRAALVDSSGGAYRVQLWSLRESQPIGKPLERRSTSIAVRFSPTGKWLVVCDDAEISLIDDVGNVQLREPSRGICDVKASVFLRDDARWIVAASGAPLRVFEPPARRATIEVPLDAGGRWAVDSTGRFLAASLEGRTVGLWDLEERRQLFTARLDASAQVDALVIVPGRIPKLAVLQDWRLHLWADGKHLTTWPSPPGLLLGPYDTRVTADGSRIAASGDTYVVVWSVDSRTPPVVVRHTEDITEFDFDPKGQFVATASRDGFARIWRTADGTSFGEALEHRAAVDGIRFLPSGLGVITWAGPVLRVWPLQERDVPLVLPQSSSTVVVGPENGPTGLASIGDLGAIRVYNAAGAELRRFHHDGCGTPTGRTQDAAMQAATDRYVRTIYRGPITGAYSADGRWLLTWKCDNAAVVWDVAKGSRIGHLTHATRVESLALGRNGQYALTGAEDGSAQLWALPDGRRIGPVVHHGDAVVAAALSPDERLAATATISSVRLWHSTTATQIFEASADGGFIEALEFSSDGGRLLVQSAGEIEMFDVRGRPRLLFRLDIPGASAARFDRAGLRFVVASTDNTARVYDARTGVPVGALMAHHADVTDARFGMADTRVVTAAGNTVQVWDASSGTPIGRELTHVAGCSAAMFTPDGARLVTLCGGSVNVRAWRSETSRAEDIVWRAEASTGFQRDAVTGSVRLLTRDEWLAKMAGQSGK